MPFSLILRPIGDARMEMLQAQTERRHMPTGWGLGMRARQRESERKNVGGAAVAEGKVNGKSCYG